MSSYRGRCPLSLRGAKSAKLISSSGAGFRPLLLLLGGGGGFFMPPTKSASVISPDARFAAFGAIVNRIPGRSLTRAGAGLEPKWLRKMCSSTSATGCPTRASALALFDALVSKHAIRLHEWDGGGGKRLLQGHGVSCELSATRSTCPRHPNLNVGAK